jgi:lysophospholipase L1-like esterase
VDDLLRKGAVALGSGALALVALELWARARWSAPWYERVVAEQAESQSIAYTENRFGLRDRDYPSPRPADRLRLLILGDSFTHGTGVRDDQLVFPELLERELDRMTWPGKSGVDVLNGGLSGSLTQQWLRLWDQVVDDFEPDALLIVFFLRDGTRLSSAGYFEELHALIDRSAEETALYRHSYLYRTLQDLRIRREILTAYRGGFDRAYLGSPEETLPWQRAQKRLLELRDDARARDIPVGLAVFPLLVELNAEHPFRAVVDEVLAFGRESGLATHDLLPAFLGHEAAELWVSPEDQHPNAAGHAIAARSLLPFAAELLRAAPRARAADQSTGSTR